MTSRRLIMTFATLAFMGCAPMRGHFEKPRSAALPEAQDTTSARYIREETRRHPELSGFRLLTNNTNALMSRITLADHAEHSIDLQYFAFKNDATGRLVAQRLLAAADRGVRVRVLLDDYELGGDYDLLDALDAHANVEVRIFNPFPLRAPRPIKNVELMLDWRLLNRRMHNKSFIVDSSVAIVGGRNIGDSYFDASSTSNFRDLDLIAIGPIVASAAHAFDDYWNSDAAIPVSAFGSRRDPQRDLSRMRDALAQHARAFAESDYAQAALDVLPAGATADRRGEWFWGTATLIADQPEKAQGEDEPALRIEPKVRELMQGAHTEVLLTSPYFVPGKHGTELLTALARKGVAVKVLTNSLASTDQPAAHSGYVHYRRTLLQDGVELYEMRAVASPTESQPDVSLHAKTVVTDRHLSFVGSLNMDRRSKVLNTEMGVIVDCPELAAAIADFFAHATQPETAFHVVLQSEPTRMAWIDQENGADRTYVSEPGANPKRRIEALLLRLLPIEGLL